MMTLTTSLSHAGCRLPLELPFFFISASGDKVVMVTISRDYPLPYHQWELGLVLDNADDNEDEDDNDSDNNNRFDTRFEMLVGPFTG